MGLDQYLDARVHLSRHDFTKPFDADKGFTENPAYSAVADLMPLGIDLYGESGISVSIGVAYWRKAYAIDAWFTAQDYESTQGWVDRDRLAELLDLVDQVLADHSKAGELLPDRNYLGGDTGYDEWYYSQLEYTQKALRHVLSDRFDNVDFYYSASW